MTNYIVLQKTDGELGHWLIIAQTAAHGPTQAVRKVSDEEGEFLAIPVRNATFVHQASEVPEPRVTSVVIHPDQYLDGQPTLPLDDDALIVEEPEPVPA